MTKNTDLYIALYTLMAECSHHEECKECPLSEFNGVYNRCMLFGTTPVCYEIEKITGMSYETCKEPTCNGCEHSGECSIAREWSE